MKYALIADIHSNIEALEAALTHANAQGATRRVFLGDLVGYGPDPVAVIERITQCVSEGDLVILGNHDSVIAGRESDTMNAEAQLAVQWTRAQLRPRHMEFLAGLPLILREDDITFVHASATAPEMWTYIYDGLRAQSSINAAGTHWVFSGHVHDPALYYAGRDGHMLPFHPAEGVAIPVPVHRKWLAIVGSCGQPRDRHAGARYALFDRAHCQLSFFRVPYDNALTAQKIRTAGLPERFARHVEGVE